MLVVEVVRKVNTVSSDVDEVELLVAQMTLEPISVRIQHVRVRACSLTI